jgi:pyruvate-formate lyase-activating enzyme
MHTILLTTDTAANAKLLADFLSTVKSVKSVSINPMVNKGEEYNWTNPSRPATDEEFEQLAKEMEQDKGEYTLEEAKALSTKKIKKWLKEKKSR